MKNKKDSNFGLFILILLLVLAVAFVIYYKKGTSEKTEPAKVEEEIKYTDEEINDYYSLAHLNYEYESSMTKEDITRLETGLTSDNFSDELKIAYGLKDQPQTNIGTEKITKPITDKDGYTYTGKYIRIDFVNEQINKILGPVKFTNKTVTFIDKRYVYDAKLNVYRIYEKKYTPNISKVTHITSDWDDLNIYITEYVAYTKINDKPQTSYTRHNNLLPINITDKNITENLDIIDKYKYTFHYNVNVNKFFLTKIEYVKQ